MIRASLRAILFVCVVAAAFSQSVRVRLRIPDHAPCRAGAACSMTVMVEDANSGKALEGAKVSATLQVQVNSAEADVELRASAVSDANGAAVLVFRIPKSLESREGFLGVRAKAVEASGKVEFR